MQVLETLYAVGVDVPPIRKQALDFGLGLDAAGQLENEGILTSSKLTESNITAFQTKLKVCVCLFVCPRDQVEQILGRKLFFCQGLGIGRKNRGLGTKVL